jgi:putative transposase
MKREVAKTIRVKLHSLTTIKEKLLSREYAAFQRAVDGENADLYSATKQQARKVRRQKNPRYEQPVVLRNDVLAVVEQDLPLSKHWVKVPVYNSEKKRGDSVWCPATVPEKDHALVREGKVADSELIRRNGEWFVHLVVKHQHTIREDYDDLLAVDMGARWIAVSVALSDRDTTFYGADVRRIREHYKLLRKRIGKAKVEKGRQVIGRIGDAESRKVEDRLHKIANGIVADATERNALIVLGDLGGIREENDKGRHANDKIHRLPFAKLRSFIEYKAHQVGIEVLTVDESYTSQYCNRCAEKGKRPSQGLFKCPSCGLEDNADKNGALNIAKRALGKFERPLSSAGAVLAQPITPAAETGELPAVVGTTPSGGTPRLQSWE